MCGIAGIIYRDGAQPHPIGRDMTRMLQSMKHRGPDSTGYALYGPTSNLVVMRYKLADANDPRDFDFGEETEYAYRVALDYDGDLKALADYVEDVTDCEVLSLGHSLEIIKDLGDAESVSDQYHLGDFAGTHAI